MAFLALSVDPFCSIRLVGCLICKLVNIVAVTHGWQKTHVLIFLRVQDILPSMVTRVTAQSLAKSCCGTEGAGRKVLSFYPHGAVRVSDLNQSIFFVTKDAKSVLCTFNFISQY